MNAPCRIELLGGLRVVQGERIIMRFRTQKAGALLGYLAYHLPQNHPREVLIEMLWPEVEPVVGRHRLSMALSSLRHQLEPPGVLSGSILQADRFHVRINPQAVVTDVAEFEAALRQNALQQALALYRGPLLPGYYEEWIVPQMVTLEELYTQAREKWEAQQKESSPSLPVLAALTPNAQRLAPNAHLPLQFTRFFGREEEIVRLGRWVDKAQQEESVTRLITLTGPGGSGKTRLAMEAARQLAQAFPGGLWFVPLADLSDPRLVPGTILDALRLPRIPDGDPLDQVTDYLNAQSAPTLLLLDNLEHLLSVERRKAEDGAVVVRALLERISTLTCLVTSRQRLDLEGEREFPVSPLPTPAWDPQRLLQDTAPVQATSSTSLPLPQHPMPERLMEFASVQMFVDRAQAIRPDFQVTQANAAAVAQLCDRLEGLPLAIELAAARSQVLTPAQMLSQLAQRFDFLVSRRRDTIDRHRTLHAAIEWSYRLLSPAMQQFFVRLSVFRGGWTPEAAEAVCEEPAALSFLEHLRECSFVLAEETAQEIRFRMYETVREFGREQIDQEEEVTLRRRHRDYFLRMAEEAEQHVLTQRRWTERLEREHDNLRAALDWCEANAQEGETGLRLAGALGVFWNVQDYLRESRERMEAALANGGEAPTLVRGKVLAQLGWSCLYQFDYEVARQHFEANLELRQALGDRHGEAEALLDLGAVWRDQREFGMARPYFEASLVLSQELGMEKTLGSSLQYLGMVAHFQGDFASAYPFYEAALAKHEAGSWIAGCILHLLGLLSYDTGDYASAHTRHAESLAIFIAWGNKKGIAHCLAAFAMLATAQGRFPRAARLFGAEQALRAPQRMQVLALDRARYAANLAAVRAALDAETFAAAWMEGQGWTQDQAIAYALEET